MATNIFGATKGIVGRNSASSADRILTTRLKEKYESKRFTVAANAYDHNVSSTESLFRSDDPGASTYHATLGYDRGYRHYIRLVIDNDCYLKFNSSSNQNIRIDADNDPFELPVEEFNNLFIRATDTTTAQVQTIQTLANTAHALNNKYFYFYASSSVGVDTTYGFWFNSGGTGTQPTDSAVDTWVAVAISNNDTASQVATALEVAIEAQVWSSSVVTDTVTATHDVGGPQKDPADPTSGGSGFTFAVTTQGAAAAAVVCDLLIV